MGHQHDETSATFVLEQLWTMGTCAAIGTVMILVYYFEVLPIFLAPKFHEPVLWGGIVLLVLVVIQAAAFLKHVLHTRSRLSAEDSDDLMHDHLHGHDHDHEHGHHHHDHHHGRCDDGECDHDHDHEPVPAGGATADDFAEHDHDHLHDHGHDHEHGWAPWRYAVLLIPVVLFAMKIPWPEAKEVTEANVLPVTLKEAEEAGNTPESQKYWKDQMKENSVRLRAKFGGFLHNSETDFRLVRLKMTCCAADAYGEPVKILVRANKKVDPAQLNNKWVKVTGKMGFLFLKDGTFLMPVVRDATVVPTNAPANQFNN